MSIRREDVSTPANLIFRSYVSYEDEEDLRANLHVTYRVVNGITGRPVVMGNAEYMSFRRGAPHGVKVKGKVLVEGEASRDREFAVWVFAVPIPTAKGAAA